jgi:hypothetical protein
MVNTISFIQANLEHSIAASRIFTRTVGTKGIDMALNTGTMVSRGLYQGLEYSRLCPVLYGRKG